MFASKEKKVIGVDVNQHAVDTINAGKIHIVEPELDVMVRESSRRWFLKGVTSPEPADAFLIAVPTPFLPTASEGEIPQPDLTYIQTAAESIAKVLKKGDLVILRVNISSREQQSRWLNGWQK